ncbi:MAG: hypothetical protein ABII13_01360 [Patescibacteria group bacterium]|nr:hypothetical protein [Patescibacteria group bacterium]MBU2509343.1 hypothetical protein [Patescibacteria group bacterium]
MNIEKVAEICELLKMVLVEMPKHLDEDEKWRKGGWFCLISEDGMILVYDPMGEVPSDKNEKYRSFSIEKATRLWKHPEHTTSRQSRNEDLDHYSGAIRARNHVFSFSGLPELWDEALMLYIAWVCAPIVTEEVRIMTTPEIFALFERLQITHPSRSS